MFCIFLPVAGALVKALKERVVLLSANFIISEYNPLRRLADSLMIFNLSIRSCNGSRIFDNEVKLDKYECKVLSINGQKTITNIT